MSNKNPDSDVKFSSMKEQGFFQIFLNDERVRSNSKLSRLFPHLTNPKSFPDDFRRILERSGRIW